MKPKDVLDTVAMNDLVGQMNISITDSSTYLRHASPQFAAFSGLQNEERSQAAARIGYQITMKGFLKVQDWAHDSLATTGWLTPGIDGPGLVDVNLAAVRRYLELGYGWNIFEKEELKPLEEWYGRFQKLAWWDALEERPNVHPSSSSSPLTGLRCNLASRHETTKRGKRQAGGGCNFSLIEEILSDFLSQLIPINKS